MARSWDSGSVSAASTEAADAIRPLLALALLATISFALMGSFGTVQESAKAELSLSDEALALVQGLGAAVPLVLFSIPVGLLVDRFHRVRLLFGLAALWTAGTILTALAGTKEWLTVARMLTGLGATGALTAALSLCADYCQPARRGRAMLIVNLGKALGAALGFALTGAIYGWLSAYDSLPHWLAIHPWRATHLLLAAVSVVATVPLLWLREPVRREVAGGTRASFQTTAGQLWARRSFLAPLFAGQVGVVMADVAAGVWVAPILSRNFGLAPNDFSAWVGALMLGAGILGAVIGGLSADWGSRTGRRGGLLTGAVIAAALGVPAALFPLMSSLPAFAILLAMLASCGAVTGLAVSVALTVFIPNEARGLCIGSFIALAGLVGYGFAPWLVTQVSLGLGGESQLAEALAVTGTVISALAFLAFLMAMRNAPTTAEPIR